MANELTWDTKTGLTLYACRFQKNGNVFLTSGASDEDWGTAGRDADDYDVTMTEEDASGHYKGDFDGSSNIGAQTYDLVIYKQLGGSPADSDPAIARGEIAWDGTAEINHFSIDADIALVTLDANRVKNVYGPDEATAEGVTPENLT